MSRRRKKKKALQKDPVKKPEAMPAPKIEEVSQETSSPKKAVSIAQPPETPPFQEPPPPSTLDPELDLEPDQFFDENSAGSSDEKISLPTSEEKLKKLRKTASLPPAAAASEKRALEEESTPSASSPKRNKMRKTEHTLPSEDELGELDDFPLEEPSEVAEEQEEVQKTEPLPVPEEVADATEPSTAQPTKDSPEPDLTQRTVLETLKEKLNSLSLIEQVSIGLLTLILAVGTVWSINVVSAQIPRAAETSRLKFPLKGNYAVLAGLETSWRSPIREGANADEGVPESIELIPEVKVILDSTSKAKALRFLFRDEEGRYAGDSSTVRASRGKFQSSKIDTAFTKGSVATVHCTTGFHHEGEIISYLADDKFRWEIVIFESKDGESFREFIAIPISAIRNDKS